MSGEAEKRSDEEYEVWRARAGERIGGGGGGGGVEVQAAHLCSQHPRYIDCLWV